MCVFMLIGYNEIWKQLLDNKINKTDLKGQIAQL